MKTLQQNEVNSISGGCFATNDGEYFDIIEVAPGVYVPVPCQHVRVGGMTVCPPDDNGATNGANGQGTNRAPRDPAPTRGPYR